MSEKTLERWLLEAVKAHGGVAIKLGGRVGLPDRLVLMPKGRVAFVELKTPRGTGRLSPMQRVWLDRLTAMGHRAEALASREAVLALLEEMAQ